MMAAEKPTAPTAKATGIVGNQGSRKTVATTSRNAGKSRIKKVAPWFAVILVVLTLLTWWRDMPDGTIGASLGTQPGKVVAAAPAWVGVQHSVQLAAFEQSKAVRVNGSQCIRWWTSEPDKHDMTVEVRGVNDSTWYAWENFRALKASGKITYDFGWVRFTAPEAGVEVFYEYNLPGMCS